MAVRLSFFDAPTIEQSRDQLSVIVPKGRAWNKKNVPESGHYRAIRVWASMFNQIQQQIEILAQEFNINLTTDLLPEWETSVGIPDDCLRDLDTLQQRRNAIISRLRKVPIVTKEEFELLGQELIGEQVVVTPGWDYDEANNFPNELSRSKMYVQFINAATGFPYSFPYPFGRFRNDLVECVFQNVKPSYVVIIFV